jgi:hypothetical protein
MEGRKPSICSLITLDSFAAQVGSSKDSLSPETSLMVPFSTNSMEEIMWQGGAGGTADRMKAEPKRNSCVLVGVVRLCFHTTTTVCLEGKCSKKISRSLGSTSLKSLFKETMYSISLSLVEITLLLVTTFRMAIPYFILLAQVAKIQSLNSSSIAESILIIEIW